MRKENGRTLGRLLSPRFIAIGLVVFFFANGAALAIVGIAALRRTPLTAGGAIVIGIALIAYAMRIALGVQRGHLPNWIKDLPHSAP